MWSGLIVAYDDKEMAYINFTRFFCLWNLVLVEIPQIGQEIRINNPSIYLIWGFAIYIMSPELLGGQCFIFI